MRKCFLLLVLAFVFSSCDDKQEINYIKNVYINDCSSDMKMIVGFTDIEDFDGQKTIFFRRSSKLYSDNKYVISELPVGGVYNEIMPNRGIVGGSDRTINSEVNVFFGSTVFEIGDSVVCSPRNVWVENSLYGTSFINILIDDWKDIKRGCDKYSEKADTAIYEFVLTDDRMESIWEYVYDNYGIHPQKVVFEE